MEIEFISKENFFEMKEKLTHIGLKINNATASEKETQYVIDVIKNTNDYSDLLSVANLPTDYSNIDNLIKIVNYTLRIKNLGLKIINSIIYFGDTQKYINDYLKALIKSNEMIEKYTVQG